MGGKRKGKIKFRNAEEARKHRELEAEWEKNNTDWLKLSKPIVKKVFKTGSLSPHTPDTRSTKHIPSRNTGEVGAVTYKAPPQYTGTKMLGISQMAKSNAVPVFDSDHIVDIARMRRG
jgi:hypothetical protein